MSPSREELVFQLALTKPAADRAAWLDRECGDDKALGTGSSRRTRLILAAHQGRSAQPNAGDSIDQRRLECVPP